MLMWIGGTTLNRCTSNKYPLKGDRVTEPIGFNSVWQLCLLSEVQLTAHQHQNKANFIKRFTNSRKYCSANFIAQQNCVNSQPTQYTRYATLTGIPFFFCYKANVFCAKQILILRSFVKSTSGPKFIKLCRGKSCLGNFTSE